MAPAKNPTPAAQQATTSKTPAQVAPSPVAPKAAAKATPVKATPAKAAGAKTAAAKAPVAKAAPAKAAPAKAAPAKAVPSKAAPAKAAPAKAAPAKAAPAKAAPAKAAPAKRPVPSPPAVTKPVPVKRLPGEVPTIRASKDFDQKFLEGQLQSLLRERETLTGQARRLEAEAHSLIEDVEMGDVQFDDESGEGDTMVVERDRDLALSAQARQVIVEIESALDRLGDGTYGYSVHSGLPILKERLRAIPWATLRVDEKAGGIGRR